MASANLNQITIAQSDNDDEDENDETTTFLQQSKTVSPPSAINPPTTMATEDNPKKKDRKKEKDDTPPSIFFQNMTTAAHASILLFVILIVFYCFSEEFVFFTWHPLLMSIGWTFLMTEAVLILSKDNIFTGTLPKKIRVRLHWIFLTISAILVAAGFTVVYINKNNLNKSHFKSWHGLFGLMAVICNIPASLDGILCLYHGALRKKIHPRINKFVHFVSGVVTFALGGVTLILSVYTKWFARHSNENFIPFLLGLVFTVFVTTWTLVRPIQTCLKQIKRMIKNE